MKVRILAVCAVAVLCVYGLERSLRPEAPGQDAPVKPVAIPSPGATCRVELLPKSTGRGITTRQTYEGQVVAADADSLELAVCTREDRVRQSTPWLSDLPVVGGLFTSVGIGRMRAVTPVKVQLSITDIAKIEAMPESTAIAAHEP